MAVSGEAKNSLFERTRQLISEWNLQLTEDERKQLPIVGNFTGILMCLPEGDIEELEPEVKRVLININNHYDVVCMQDIGDDMTGELKIKAENAKASGKSGIILLTCRRGTEAISLPFINIVCLLNDTIAVDPILQMEYRCLTESPDKRFGFVFDFKPNRWLISIINYLCPNVHGKKQQIKKMIDNKEIHVDERDFDLDIVTDQMQVSDKIYEIYKKLCIPNFTKAQLELKRSIKFTDEELDQLSNIEFEYIERCDQDRVDDIEVPTGLGKTEEEEDEGKEEIDREVEEEEEDDLKNKREIWEKIFITTVTTIIILTRKYKNEYKILNLYNKMSKELKGVLVSKVKSIRGIKVDKKDIEKMLKMKKEISIDLLKEKLSVSIDDKNEDLVLFLEQYLKPEVYEKRTYGEVFTPPKIINDMLDALKAHDPLIFSNPKFKFFDPANGIGNFLIFVYKRLMEGLSEKIPNERKRKRHILENMLYSGELNKYNAIMYQMIMDPAQSGEYPKFKEHNNIGNSLELDIFERWGIESFDVILGNPPYNTEMKKCGSSSLYHKFIEKYEGSCRYLTMITPSRWFVGGKGLDKFRSKMTRKKTIVYIHNFPDASKIFGSFVKIDGGVNYFLIDRDYNGLCSFNGVDIKLDKYDIIVPNVEYYSIIDKVIRYKSKLTSIFLGRGGIETNGSDELEEKKIDKNYLLCFMSKKKEGNKYIHKKYVSKEYQTWKVITTRVSKHGFGNTFIGSPKEVHTGSYVSFGVKSEEEAKNLLSYLKTKFAVLLFTLRKITRDISEKSFAWIPLVPLDRKWSDKKVYDYFSFSEEEIEAIENYKI